MLRALPLGYVWLGGQEPAPSKCVHMSTSRAVRSDMGAGWFLVRVIGGLSSWMFGILSSIYLGFSGTSCHFSIGSCLCSSVGFSWAASSSSLHVYSWCFAWY